MYQVDSAILMNQKVWQASGHATGFNDPLVECSNCHSRLRADHLAESWQKKMIENGSKTADNPAVGEDSLLVFNFEGLKTFYKKNKANIKCPVCGKNDTLGEPRQFNMMFKTNVGPTEDENSVSYLRPETAQGMFVNFKNIVDTFSPDMPFGMAQIGKAFRNEISPRDFLFRVREMEQMEIEYFCRPENWEKDFEEWRSGIKAFFAKVGLPEGSVHELEVPEEDRAHYSKRTIDYEFDFPFGRKELAGLAYRGDYDLSKHQEASGKNLQYRPKDGSDPFLPHVIEPSFGVERLVLAVLTAAYATDEQGGEERTYLKLPASIAPVKVAVLPLVKNKPELTAKAKEIYKKLSDELGNVMWVDTGNIGKNYRKMDEIGTPHCVTVDFQTLEDDTVTVRSRDTTEQTRQKISELKIG